MSPWIGVGLLIWAVAYLARRALEDAPRSSPPVRIDAGDLEGECHLVPALVSVEHLEPPVQGRDRAGSPYRLEDADDRAIDERNRFARNALATARWLLLAAVQDADAAGRARARGRTRDADLRSLAQTRAESEALQCIFEAEDRLGLRIVRAPSEGRCLAPYYGRAAELLATVDAWLARAFPIDRRS